MWRRKRLVFLLHCPRFKPIAFIIRIVPLLVMYGEGEDNAGQSLRSMQYEELGTQAYVDSSRCYSRFGDPPRSRRLFGLPVVYRRHVRIAVNTHFIVHESEQCFVRRVLYPEV
ncbi:hypothetical protein F5Y16DRAFT_391007 [Xylariaceae sp. FL0255]|nr:hypothetical protein F5Y16DRAFT_391007 [Xylariaceae sp. FL0255]